jgi:polysaccharide deacetylase family protein (PEP-CTERM system associated)
MLREGRETTTAEEAADETGCLNAFSCELEDWFHILDSDRVPALSEWPTLPLRAERNMETLLQLLYDTGSQATLFCLGWMAERMPQLVRRCQQAGHEIGSHGYAHIMAGHTNHTSFRQDITRAKGVLEDIIGKEVAGFRCPGFGVRNDNEWFFNVVAESGYKYDASVFPAYHGHGGFHGVFPGPHIIETASGPLAEIPVSTVSILGYRVCFFGGGYLRLAPLPVIRWGIRQLQKENRPLVVYVHPREIDPDHPRLPLGPWRGFKCYHNLESTLPKLKWLCENHRFGTMAALAARAGEASGSTVPDSAVVLTEPSLLQSP